MIEIYKEIIKSLSKKRRSVLATVINTKTHTPRNIGAKMLLKDDGTTVGSIGGGNLELRIINNAKKLIVTGKSELMHFDLKNSKDKGLDMMCGGEMDVFLEPIIPKYELFIFGGGHVAIPLSKLANFVGFDVYIIDDRKEYAAKERFSEVKKAIHQDFKKAFEIINIGSTSFIVIITAKHSSDGKVLENAIKTPARYIGMMGSPKKREQIFQDLMEKGISKDLLKKVYSPIGVSISSETPEEIAVSIVAEMIKVRNT